MQICISVLLLHDVAPFACSAGTPVAVIREMRPAMLRKSAVIATLGVLGLGMTACSSGSAASSGTGGGSTSGMNIQFVNPLPKYPAWRSVGDCMKKEAEKRGAHYSETGPTGQAVDVNAMISQIQQGISTKKSAIVTFPASDGFAPVLKQAQKAGIVTTTVIGPGTKDSGADANVGLDWSKLGEMYVAAIAKRPGTQYVGLEAAANSGPGGEWMAGLKAAAAKTSNVKVVGAVYTGDDSAKALQQTQALLTAHPNINVIASHMGTVTQGAVAAIKAKGKTGKVVLVGNGHDNGGTEAMASGAAYALLFQNLCDAGTKSADVTIDMLKKKQTAPPSGGPKNLFYGVTVATKDNYRQFIDKGWS